MLARQNMHYLLIFVLLAAFNLGGSTSQRRRVTRSDGSDWSYAGENGPDHWTGTCSSGHKQSPINIGENRKRLRGDSLSFEGAYKQKVTWKPSWNGHHYQAVMEKKYHAIVEGGDLGDHFVFQSLHIHWGSEHTVEKERYTAEMHLVHHNAKYTAEEAASKPDGLAVLGIFLEEQEDVEDAKMSDFIKQMTASPSKPINSTSLYSLLPSNINSWIRYHGSLTTPPCSENVKWTVFLKPVPIHIGLVEMSQHHNSSYRPTEPLKGRLIYEFKARKGHEWDERSISVGIGNGVTMYASVSSVVLCLFSVLLAGK